MSDEDKVVRAPRHVDPRLDRWIAKASSGKPVRARFAGASRISVDRALPFLAVYRDPAVGKDQGTAALLGGTAAFARGHAHGSEAREFVQTIRAYADAMQELFGAFLLLELWTDADVDSAEDGVGFQLHAGRSVKYDSIVGELHAQLSQIRFGNEGTRVSVVRGSRTGPKGRGAMSTKRVKPTLWRVGVAMRPVHRDARSGKVIPKVARALRRELTGALQRAFYGFSCSSATSCPRDYHMLGRRELPRVVWDVDEQLATIAESFDFLLQVSPTNAKHAWETFRERNFEVDPVLLYRPMVDDSAVLKRRLYAPRIERVEDPVLEDLLRSKQAELDRQITLLDELGTHSFLLGGVQLYGAVEPRLLRLAKKLLVRCPVDSGRDDTTGGAMNEEELAKRAMAEVEAYKAEWSGFGAHVEVRDDLVPGLMVSQGNILIGRGTRVPARRVDALLQHEVGTHALTYHNARVQPLRLLASGLEGYDAFQEGLAVVAEFVAGGLGRARLRLLGARVIAVEAMARGASFVDTFRLLTRDHGFEPSTAFNIALRIHRGGGLVKDAVYLRGLVQALDYIGSGGSIDPLAMGKLGPAHAPLIRELLLRGVLKPPPLMPHYLKRESSAPRLAQLRRGLTVLDLVNEAPF